MKDRRKFLKQLGLTAGAIGAFPLLKDALAEESREYFPAPDEFSSDEDFWRYIQQEYTSSPNLINLNNGGVSPHPKVVQEAVETYNRVCNEAPSYYMWRILDKHRESLRMKLAELAGCDAEEIAMNRNTTEALDTIIFGLNLEEGDEVILSPFDYPNMKNAWRQREKRDGIKLVWVDLPLPMEDDDEIISIYEKAMTKKTKIVLVTHMINYTGQILPARKIADMVHSRGAEVVIDGAHTFAHLDYKIPDLGGDYFGTSLHKWLCAPFGTGMMWVKKEKISSLWPVNPNADPQKDDIRKFEHLGTRSVPTEQAIGQAINFHNMIGGERKEARLRWLKNYWADQVKDLPKVKLFTSLKPEYSCALATIAIEGLSNKDMANQLMDDYRIHVTTIDEGHVSGVRITPHVYTTTEDLDRLVKAIKKMAS